jgi:hypothetical protein
MIYYSAIIIFCQEKNHPEEQFVAGRANRNSPKQNLQNNF